MLRGGFILVAGEQYCDHYQKQYGLNITVIRTPFIYGPHEHTSFLFDLVRKCNTKSIISLPREKDKICNFLHADDVVSLVKQIITEPINPDVTIINLSSSQVFSYYKLSEYLSKTYPSVNFQFDLDIPIYTKIVEVLNAKRIYNWVDVHDFSRDMEVLIPEIEQTISKRKKDKRYLHIQRTGEVIKWLELFIAAFLMHFLTEFTGTLIQFRYVDFRLLFVVLMASVYGIRFGLFAAVLASASILYTWYEMQFNWTLISNNVGNWFPFVIYFATGLILGYYHDKHEREIEHEKEQTSLIYEKFKFLFDVFSEINKLKDDFRQKLLGYRDSFGRIYSITQDLDHVDEDMIFLKALPILENLLENDSIAIYSIGNNKNFARLEVNSTSLNGSVPRSLNFDDFPELKKNIHSGQIYHNASLLKEHPMYASPVMNKDEPVALILIMDSSFDQQTMYYFNLIKVITGLIQASLVRAANFANLNAENLYVPMTRILKPNAFQNALKIRMDMKKNKISDYQILSINFNNRDLKDLYQDMSENIRANDLIGSDYGGNYYVVLSQADKESINEIAERFRRLHIETELVEDEEIIFGENDKKNF